MVCRRARRLACARAHRRRPRRRGSGRGRGRGRSGGPAAEPVTVLAAGEIADCARPDDERTAALVAREPGTVLVLGGRPRPRHPRRVRAVLRADLGKVPRSNTARSRRRRLRDPGRGRLPVVLRPRPDVLRVRPRRLAAVRARQRADHGVPARLASPRPRAQPAPLHPRVLAHAAIRLGPPELTAGVRPFWRILHRAGAEIVLNASQHNYERFFRIGADDELEWAHGIREFVVARAAACCSNGRGRTTTAGRSTPRPTVSSACASARTATAGASSPSTAPSRTTAAKPVRIAGTAVRKGLCKELARTTNDQLPASLL